MRSIKIELIKKAADALKEAASALDMDLEETFEYLVRNTLKVYHIVELRGSVRLIDEIGNMEILRFPEDSQAASLVGRVAEKLRVKPRQFEPTESEKFSTLVDDELAEAVDLQASVFGLVSSNLYNRLVIVGSILAIHLEDGQAFAYSQTGDALGKIEFTLR